MIFLVVKNNSIAKKKFVYVDLEFLAFSYIYTQSSSF